MAGPARFETIRASLNQPPFPIRSPERAEALLRHDTTVIIYAGSRTDANLVGETVSRVHQTMEFNPGQGDEKIWLVTPDPVATTLEQAGYRVLRPEQVLGCVDTERITTDFGSNLIPSELRSGHALLAGILFQRLLHKKGHTLPGHDLLIQGKRGASPDVPLLWLSWFAEKYKSLMVQERQWNGANEAITYRAVSLAQHGSVGQDMADTLRRGWLGSSLVLTVPEILGQSPNATNIRGHDLILALSAAEIARRQGGKLIQLGKSYPDAPEVPDLTDNRLIVTENLLDALVKILISKNIKLTEATADDIRQINEQLQRSAAYWTTKGTMIGGVLPPVDALIDQGYILPAAVEKLLQQEAGKQWTIPERTSMPAVQPIRRERLRELARRSGLVPPHDPASLSGLLDQSIARNDQLRENGTYTVFYGNRPGERPDYSVSSDPELIQEYRVLARLMLYNQPIGSDGRPHPYDILGQDMGPIRDRVVQGLRGANLRIVVPFAGEEESVGGVLRYLLNLVNKNIVIAADAGRSRLSTSIVNFSGARRVDQISALNTINWPKLKADGVLPTTFPVTQVDLASLLNVIDLKRFSQSTLSLSDDIPVKPRDQVGPPLQPLLDDLVPILNAMDWEGMIKAGYLPPDFQARNVNNVNLMDVFTRVGLDRLEQYGVLPNYFVLRGSKSLTLLAGLLELEKQHCQGEISDDTMVAFHDSDIKNSDKYAAMHYLWLPMIFHPEGCSPRAVHLAKSGPGRNNSPIFVMITRYMNSPDERIRRLGFAMAPLVWPLAGERMIRWGDLRRCLWTNGMGIETALDVQLAAMDVVDGVRRLFQIANRIDKAENRPSAEEREHGMINGLGGLADYLGRASSMGAELTRYLHEWDTGNIGQYNEMFGGRPFPMTFADTINKEVPPNYLRTGRIDYILPSLAQMEENAYIIQ